MSARGDEPSRPRDVTDLRSALGRYPGYLLLGGAVLALLGLVYLHAGKLAADVIGEVAVVVGLLFLALAAVGMARRRT